MMGLKFPGGPCFFLDFGSINNTPSLISSGYAPASAMVLKMFAIC